MICVMNVWEHILGGGFGAALIESFDIDRATPEQLVEMAQSQGINLRNYQV